MNAFSLHVKQKVNFPLPSSADGRTWCFGLQRVQSAGDCSSQTLLSLSYTYGMSHLKTEFIH